MSAATNRLSIHQHDEEIHCNARAWEQKPWLRKVYRSFHERVKEALTQDVAGFTVEIGSGIGQIKKTLPNCITSDLFPNPWLDRQENAYALSFDDNCVANLILFDVWHHLQFPGAALKEFARVIVPGGRLIIFEPAMSLLGRIVYGRLHPEPTAWDIPIVWETPKPEAVRNNGYFAAQSWATRIFLHKEETRWETDWNILGTEKITSFVYWLSGGFSKPQMCPDSLMPLVNKLDRGMSLLPNLFAARLLLVLERK